MRAFLAQAPIAVVGLSSPEQMEYASWGDKEKSLFLFGYQWLSAISSPRLPVLGSNQEYEGLLPSSLSAVTGFLLSAQDVMKILPPDAITGISEIDAASKSVAKTSGGIDEAIRRWKPLRNRVVQDFVDKGIGVEYEYFGDAPEHPGTVYLRRVAKEGEPADVSAVFSKMTPQELAQAGLRIQNLYYDDGVEFEKSKLGEPSAFPILLAIVLLIVGVIAFFAVWSKADQAKGVGQAYLDAIKTLPADKQAEALRKWQLANSILGGILGPDFPWTTLILVAGAIGVAAFAVPPIVNAIWGKGATA